MSRSAADRQTRVTLLVALAARRVIATARTVGGLISGSPTLLSKRPTRSRTASTRSSFSPPSGAAGAIDGMSLHLATGRVVREAAASLGIGLLLVPVAFRLSRKATGTC